MSKDGTVKFYERQNKKFDDEIKESIECCSIFKDQGFLKKSQCYKRRGSTCSHSEHRS